MLRMKSEGSRQENSLLLERASLFVLFNPSTDCIRPTYIMENHLPYSESTSFSMNLIQKYSYRNTENKVCTTYVGTYSSWHTKLTIKNCFYVYPIVFDPIFWKFFFGNTVSCFTTPKKCCGFFFSNKKGICVSWF